MTLDFLFEATPKWEQAIEKQAFSSVYGAQIALYFLLDGIAITTVWTHHLLTSGTLGIVLGFCLSAIMGCSFIINRLCSEVGLRLRSSFIDADSRRSLLNVSYMSFRLYVFLIATPGIILLAILATQR